MSWSESADFRKYLRSEVRKQAPWIVIRNVAFIALCIFAGTLPSWMDADPERRLPLWALPIPPTIAAATLGVLFVVLPQRLSKNRVIIREDGIQYGSGLYGKQWMPIDKISGYVIEDEEAESGAVFTFLEFFQTDDTDTIATQIPSNIGKDSVRALLSSLDLNECLPEELKD